METPVSVGIAGYGYWGPNLARNFQRLRSTVLKAVCDPDPGRRRHLSEIHPGTAAYGGFREMMESERLDAVVVATPARSHYELAKAALEAGKHVLVEKPMATSSAECRELVELAGRRNLVLMVGHTYLYSEAVRKLFDIIRSGDLGELSYVNCQRLNFGLFQKDINVAWDLAPHDLSIILRVMGRLPVTVNCLGRAHMRPGVEAVTNLSLDFGDCGFATVQSSWLEPRKVRQMTFVGTRKMVVYNDLEPHGKLRVYDTRVECPPHYDSFAEFHYSYHYGECRIPHLEQVEPLNRMCGHFAECVAFGTRPETPGDDGLAVVRVLEACAESLRADGAPVKVAEAV